MNYKERPKLRVRVNYLCSAYNFSLSELLSFKDNLNFTDHLELQIKKMIIEQKREVSHE